MLPKHAKPAFLVLAPLGIAREVDAGPAVSVDDALERRGVALVHFAHRRVVSVMKRAVRGERIAHSHVFGGEVEEHLPQILCHSPPAGANAVMRQPLLPFAKHAACSIGLRICSSGM